MLWRKLYTDPNFPGAFGGKKQFYREVRKLYPLVKYKDIEKFLISNDSYTLHKPVRAPRKYRRIYTKFIGYLYQIDLVDMSKFSRENDGFKWIITCIDTFSKKAWVFKTKDKTGLSVTRAMKNLLQEQRPHKIQFDEGKEFLNHHFLDLLRRNGIKHYSTYSEVKCAIAERFNRSLKTRMYRAFTAQGNHRYVDILQNLVDGYNNSKHRSIGMTPNEVNLGNQNIVRKMLYPRVRKRLQRNTLKINQSVRITRKKGIFQKGYEQSFSYEVFKITNIKNTYPVTYSISDYKGEPVLGSFYKEELQVVDKSDDIYLVEQIINQRTVNGQRQYLVKWAGYPDAANTWIVEADLFKL